MTQRDYNNKPFLRKNPLDKTLLHAYFVMKYFCNIFLIDGFANVEQLGYSSFCFYTMSMNFLAFLRLHFVFSLLIINVPVICGWIVTMLVKATLKSRDTQCPFLCSNICSCYQPHLSNAEWRLRCKSQDKSECNIFVHKKIILYIKEQNKKNEHIQCFGNCK